MRKLLELSVITALLVASAAHAEQSSSMKKVKLGLLPSGGFYRLYTLECGDGSPASIARVEHSRRWCTSQGESLDCFRQSTDAMAQACNRSDKLAAAGSPTNAVGQPQ